MTRPASAFCCEECGHIHTSEHTALDTFCPRCDAPRELQQLAQCRGCCMTVYRDIEGGWWHCDDFADEQCPLGVFPQSIYLRGLNPHRRNA